MYTPLLPPNYHLGMDFLVLSFVVVVVGGMGSLPGAVAAGFLLGILQSFAVAYLPSQGTIAGLRAVVPAVFLFVVIVAMPQAQLRIGQVKGIVSAPLPSFAKSVGWGAGLLLLVAMLAVGMSTANLLLDTADEDEVGAYVARAEAAVPGTSITPVAQENGKTLLRASWEGNSQDDDSLDVVKDLREVPGPEGTGSDGVLIGGLTADTVDLLSSIKSHLPWMAGIIVAVMLALLFLAFGSLVLPVKAVLMNVLSISASFGVITWIFADGRLEGFLDYSSTGFLDATQPIFMLAILVGLSMDYEVFLLSRVREQWDKTEGSDLTPTERNTDAVAVGVQKTGKIITSAALLLAVVIGGFSTSGIVFMKMIGVGMLVALLVDATVVRALLVPATMKLLGRWNWWAPAPLLRFWERYGVRENEFGSADDRELEDLARGTGRDRDRVAVRSARRREGDRPGLAWCQSRAVLRDVCLEPTFGDVQRFRRVLMRAADGILRRGGHQSRRDQKRQAHQPQESQGEGDTPPVEVGRSRCSLRRLHRSQLRR